MTPPPHLTAGRTLFGDSLGFHIIFALLGVGLPLLISLAELIGIYKKDPTFTAMARRWSFAMGTLFVVGAVSGIIISMQMNLLWPTFMAFAGKVIALPFSFEGYAFFVEAIFLGIYLYSWEKFKNPITHWLTSLPIVLGSAASAFFITAANAFMNNPQGFDLVNGQPTNINPWKAMFNRAVPTETSHSIVAYYLTSALILAGILAVGYLKERKTTNQAVHEYYKKALVFLVSFAFIFSLLMGVTGDRSGKYLANQEPRKLAAAEGLFETQSHAPLKLGGVVKDNQIKGAITIPGMLSILAHNKISATVIGLDAFDPSTWPPLWIHYMFDAMVGIGGLLGLIPVLFLGSYLLKKPGVTFSKTMLLTLPVIGFLSVCAVEFGWILTEVGRQPYVINGVMKTADAFTTASNVEVFGSIFPTLYLVLFILTYWILRRYYKTKPLDESLKATKKKENL